MGDDDDAAVAPQFVHQLLDMRRRQGIERGPGLLEQNDLAIYRDRAGDAKGARCQVLLEINKKIDC